VAKRSEMLWEAFCARHGLACEAVPTASSQGEQRPDYRVVGADGVRFFAEVKEVTPNELEAKQIQRLLAGEIGEFSTEPGARVRQYIDKANPQLKIMTKGLCPGVLVIFNEIPFLTHHTEAYAILTAMRGLDVVPVYVPRDPNLSPEFQDVCSGPKKQMTAGANTSTSALILPFEEPGTGSSALVYHNKYAACPLPLSSLPGPLFRHYGIRSDEREWELLDSALVRLV
jgi:hypothetical protein